MNGYLHNHQQLLIDESARFEKLYLIKMTDTNKNEKKKCGSKGKVMLTYGIVQLGSSLISAVALAAIALGFCSLKKEARFFNECVEEVQESGKSTSTAVRFCNGGK